MKDNHNFFANGVLVHNCQAIANPKAKRAIALRNIIRLAEVEHFVPMSGTPISNRPIEFWSVLNMLDPKKFPSYYSFGHRYCKPKRNPFGGWDFSGAANLDELHENLKGYMIRRKKCDVLTELPPKQQSVIPLSLSNRREYEKARKDFVSWMRKNYSVAKVTRAMRAEGLTKMNYLKRLISVGKRDAVGEWIENFLQSGEKLIVFATGVELVESFREKYGKRFCATVNGGVVGAKRQYEVDRFNDDPNCRLMAANMKSGGAGISITSCSNCAFLEMAWNPGTHSQCTDRTHGLYRGQEGVPSMSHWLIARDTVEVDICKLILKKWKNLDSILDGRPTEEASVFDELMSQMMED